MKTRLREKIIFLRGIGPIVFMEFIRTIHIFVYIIFIFFNELYSYKVKVNTNQGVIHGIKEVTVFKQQSYFAFYGVPYAQVPVGRLRFQNPKPLKRFSKAFDATLEYHGACAQAHIVHKQALYGQEDCLRLNIYTPNIPKREDKKLKAVIVWIHGYAFTSSFSHVYRPDCIIENDVLFVSLTHRLGVFGFIKVNESNSKGNMGLKDIIIGLKWIRKNVVSFGGDKNKITLMCSGSGGTFALLLFLTKHRRLFQKLIIHSGSMFSPSLFQGLKYLEQNKLEGQMKTGGFKDYLTAPAGALVTASNKIYSSKDIINVQRPLVPFLPLIEEEPRDTLITLHDFEAYERNRENEHFNIPILTGFTSQESISELIPFIHNSSYLKSLGRNFKYMVPFLNGCSYNHNTNTYKSISKGIIQRYFKKYPDISLDEFLEYSSDLLKYPMYKFIKTHTNHKNRNLFVYKFNYNGNFNVMKSTSLAGLRKKLKGSAHGDELCYILKCEPLWENYVKIKSDKHNKDRIFMNEIVTMWTNFAKFGNPTPTNYKSNITWLPMTSKNDNLLVFDKTRTIMINSKAEATMYKFWNSLYDNYYLPKHCNKLRDEL